MVKIKDKTKSLKSIHNSQIRKQISNDINLSIDQGKPKKQAVAIALAKNRKSGKRLWQM